MLFVTSLIYISIKLQKIKLLTFSSLIYLIFGLGLFGYLIIAEMYALPDGGMQPIEDSKPKIYYDVFLTVIICLNISAGIFRLLGSIFVLIYIKVLKKSIKRELYIFIFILIN